jgi:hypothetical protein
MMAPLLLPCLAALMRALPRCQAKSLLCGYDLLGALLRGVPRDLVAPAGAQIWPVLLRSCTTTPPDRRLVALLDCIANSILALGATVAPHAAPLLRRSLELGLVQLRAAADRARQEASLLAELRAHRPDATATESADVVQARLGASAVDVDFAIVAIDMCGSVCEALGAQCVAPLGQLPLGDLLREAVACKDASVRQVRALVMFLVFSFFSLGCVWAGRGLVAARVGAAAGAAGGCAAGAAAGQSVRLARVAVHERVLGAGRAVCARPSSRDGPLLRNVAITLCRLAPSCPALLASTLHETAPYWLPPLATIKVLLFSFLFPLVCLNGVFCSRAPTESGRTRWC